ncbi:MAG: hypothetical protein DID89_2727546647 [Candidatus Nitrotoga sp. CP45]|nr:MAG: hypothetical protein DID89_2727546647 [Candidatus Nitrotoga sp. CP45]
MSKKNSDDPVQGRSKAKIRLVSVAAAERDSAFYRGTSA